jgi:PAS domain S-box-containing protein
MIPRQKGKLPAQPTAAHTHQKGAALRSCIAGFGTLAALAGLIEQFPITYTLVQSVLAAIYMILVLLCGYRLAGASALVYAALAWLLLSPDDALCACVVLVLAIAGGEGLRRGMRPFYLCAPLLLACLADDLLSLSHGTPLRLAMSGRAFIEATANVSMATVAFMAVPRRSSLLPPRSRTRLEHVLFTTFAGTVALIALAVLMMPDAAGSDLLVSALAGVTLAAFVASIGLSHVGHAALRRMQADAQQTVRRRRLRRLPLEMKAACVSVARRCQALARRAGADRNQLHQLQDTAARLQDELQRAQEALQQKTVDLRRMKSAALQIRSRFDALMDGVPAAVLFTTPDGTIQHANRATLSLLGHAPDSLRGRRVVELVPDAHLLDHPLSTGGTGQLAATRRIESCNVLTGRGVREVAVQVIPYSVGEQQHRLVLLREADATRRAMAALEQAQVVTRSMHQSRDMFIATMSHEMRTPLHGLIATLDMLRGSEATGEFQHQLAIARSSAKALLKIANDVLDFTRIGSAQFALDRRPFSMTRLLREVLEEAHARAASLGLELKANIPAQLPPSFIGDPARLKQILGNLVSNALKFTREGSVTLDVAWDGRQCLIDVIDTGEGIPQDKRERIFEPFVQAHSRNRSQPGTGLGLPISRRLAEAMGGDLVLLRSGDDGSTFRLSLRLPASDEAPPEDQSLRVFSNPRGRILVVEDNPANQYVAKALLAGLECPATIVGSGAEALELLREQEFDLILMDCQMPGMDGFETTRFARRILKKHVPIIAMTANAMTEDRKACLDAGMDDFLPKPFDRRALNDLLCKWLAPAKPAAETPDVGTQMARLPDLDEQVLEELWESLQWRIAPLTQIRQTFAESLKPLVPLLRSASPADRPALQRYLHTLLGSAGMVGARQIEFLAGQLRHALQEERYEFLKSAADDLERAMVRYNREFENWLEKDRGAGRGQEAGSGLRIVNNHRLR